MNIYVSNLSFTTTSERLLDLFAEYEGATSANIITDRDTGISHGFDYIEMHDDTERQKDISEFDEREFEGKKINVCIARLKIEKSGDSFNIRSVYNRRQY